MQTKAQEYRRGYPSGPCRRFFGLVRPVRHSPEVPAPRFGGRACVHAETTKPV